MKKEQILDAAFAKGYRIVPCEGNWYCIWIDAAQNQIGTNFGNDEDMDYNAAKSIEPFIATA